MSRLALSLVESGVSLVFDVGKTLWDRMTGPLVGIPIAIHIIHDRLRGHSCIIVHVSCVELLDLDWRRVPAILRYLWLDQRLEHARWLVVSGARAV